jgi:N-acetyl-1-D-myo-inositol-2-amino-2-deoxy-alpha-D-glucopyranoside deacetylase
MSGLSEPRLLLVHAHPDDETINNGATMARYARTGAGVTLVTCTRGELGEVLVDEHAHRAAHREDTLGDYRQTELVAAMKALGVTDHRYLGAPDVVYRDSGMVWGEAGQVLLPDDAGPDCFALSDPEAAAGRLADVVRRARPHVLITYEPGGGYGHPDHVMAHRVAMRAVDLAARDAPDGTPGWAIPKVYWAVAPENLVRAALRELALQLGGSVPGWDPDGPLPSMFVPDEQVTACVDASAWLPHKVEALRAYATQVTVNDEGTALTHTGGQAQPIVGVEFYQLARGEAGGERDEFGRETDLFAGLRGVRAGL